MRLVSVFTACKTRLLAIPSRARQALPHLVAADLGVLEALIREALEDLVEAKK
jgi:phage terminase Nu1 subunit (DNA packaging protein)